MSKVVRDLSTPENEEFWRVVTAAAHEVSSWPDWKRAGINIATERSRIDGEADQREPAASSGVDEHY